MDKYLTSYVTLNSQILTFDLKVVMGMCYRVALHGIKTRCFCAENIRKYSCKVTIREIELIKGWWTLVSVGTIMKWSAFKRV